MQELGASDVAENIEADCFDPFCKHLLLWDGDEVVGTYRLLDDCGAEAAGGFYSETEYDLSPLRSSGRTLLEMGRSCIRADHRGGTALAEMWGALAQYVGVIGADVIFGVASFHGTHTACLAQPLSYLAANHLAPADLRPRSKAYASMDLLESSQFDRARAVKALPTLVKSYLKLGGYVGDGAFVDHSFNTVDVCLVLDTARIPSPGTKHRWRRP